MMQKSAQHLHPTVHQRINQALSEISHDVANVSALRAMGNTVPLYENTDFSPKQPAGRPIMPIRSVFTDVGYQSTLKLQDKSDPNDKFSIRTEIGKQQNKTPSEHSVASSSSSSNKKNPIDASMEARLNPGVIKRVPPTGESGSPEGTLQSPYKGGPNHSTPTAESDASSGKDANDSTKDEDEHLGEKGLKDSLFSSQMRKLNRELPISEVYHERNIGLGMAPPLSKLIMTNNLQVVQVEHHSDSEPNSSTVSPPPSLIQPSFASPVSQQQQPLSLQTLRASLGMEDSFNNIDNLSVIEDAHQRNSLASSSRTVIIKDTPEAITNQPDITQAKQSFGIPSSALLQHSHHHHNLERPQPQRRPPVPPRPTEEAWYNTSISPSPRGGDQHMHMMPVAPQPHGHHHNVGFPRDDGDGRSMTDSQYSGCSPNGTNLVGGPAGGKLRPVAIRGHHLVNGSLASQISYMKMKDYMNDQEITVLEEKEVSPGGGKPKPVAAVRRDNFNPGYANQEMAQEGNMRPRDIANYINTQFKMPEPAMRRRPMHIGPGQQSPLDRHPQQIWPSNRDKNAGFTYTGMFSSDC